MMWRDCGKIGVIFMSGLKGSSEKSALFKQKKEEKKSLQQSYSDLRV